jgi:hypothetical protein
MDEETLTQINRMCEIILGNNFGNKELDSLAFNVGHHPDVLNPKRIDIEGTINYESK